MQKGKEYTEMEVFSLPTAKNQEELLTFSTECNESTQKCWDKNGEWFHKSDTDTFQHVAGRGGPGG